MCGEKYVQGCPYSATPLELMIGPTCFPPVITLNNNIFVRCPMPSVDRRSLLEDGFQVGMKDMIPELLRAVGDHKKHITDLIMMAIWNERYVAASGVAMRLISWFYCYSGSDSDGTANHKSATNMQSRVIIFKVADARKKVDIRLTPCSNHCCGLCSLPILHP